MSEVAEREPAWRLAPDASAEVVNQLHAALVGARPLSADDAALGDIVGVVDGEPPEDLDATVYGE